MKHYVFGDIHGAGLELKQLLDIISPTSDDRLVFVGDVFDRGLDADAVWEIIQEFNVDVTMGNHEHKMMHWLQGRRDSLPPHYYVALNILQSKCDLTPSDILGWLEKRPLMKLYGDFVVSHAGVNPSDPNAIDVSWNVYGNAPSPVPRPKDGDGNKYFWDSYDGDRLVLYGHWVTGDNLPRIRRNSRGRVNSIGLDTAVVHGGNITAYCPEDDRFYSYSSGIEWGDMLKSQMKKRAPIVDSALLAFVKKNREALEVELGVKKVLQKGSK